ncbi:TnsD family Tn7-like transposition protein [Acinetobacter pollinis]|uniref:TnsD family Tn7-like transposition protein n=1 Tax=Acinetobacter pollinis TaxID=2605270 RepID=UPI0018C30592|nr:TnsD family Tn7-like transposition protein [Acinetobacter pollinis]MBF7693142.1 TniQ family protein [Acinetobacter pollinis]MBF7700869.1 TniQ family protein [Acinetobacter pollinis]
MLNFPTPYPNELIYSTIARAGIHHAITSPKQLLEEVFANRKVIATIDLPSHLTCLLTHLSLNYTLEKIVYEHTLFPIHALFSPENTRLKCLHWMGSQSKGSIHLALGIAASKVKQITTHRYCHHCLEEQYHQYGEFFWSRLWYIQGANCCSKHKVKLSEFLQPAHLNGRHQFIPASFILDRKQPHNPAHQLDLIISKRIDELLKLPLIKSPTFHQWSQFYQRIAKQLGFNKGSKHIDHSKVYSTIVKIWDLNWLHQHHLDELKSETSWLKAIFRKHRKSFSYLEHIIVLETFHPKGWTWKSILSEIQQLPSDSPNTSMQVQVTEYKDISILIEKRNAWTSLIQKYGIKPSRIKNAALYAWLYRNDKTWLLNKNRKFHTLPIPSRKKINWSLRDWQLVKQLFKTFYKSEDHLNLPRQSRNWYLRQLPQHSTVEKNLYQLPLTHKFLNTFSEDISSYQIRRITRTIIRFKKMNQHPANWQLLRHSGLSEERLTDEALKFLNQMKRMNHD